jgi:hypothetical protein
MKGFFYFFFLPLLWEHFCKTLSGKGFSLPPACLKIRASCLALQGHGKPKDQRLHYCAGGLPGYNCNILYRF